MALKENPESCCEHAVGRGNVTSWGSRCFVMDPSVLGLVARWQMPMAQADETLLKLPPAFAAIPPEEETQTPKPPINISQTPSTTITQHKDI